MKINFEEIHKAVQLLEKFNQMDIEVVGQQFAEFSGQHFDDKIYENAKNAEITNQEFLYSLFLVKQYKKNMQMVLPSTKYLIHSYKNKFIAILSIKNKEFLQLINNQVDKFPSWALELTNQQVHDLSFDFNPDETIQKYFDICL